ncbi:hypothetical protein [Faecalibacillus faecis]|uniref:hypothetical protein n=1 Tax=Faecalibacillus faecis TaxID=1982628 RepID=UPI00386BC95A
MESKKLFNEVFEEVNDVNISGGAGATDAQCHHWYVEGFLSGFGTGQYYCDMWRKYCSNPVRK